MTNSTSFSAVATPAASSEQPHQGSTGLDQVWEQQRDRLELLTNFMEALRARLLAYKSEGPYVVRGPE